MNVTIIKQPKCEPINLEEVKSYLRIDHTAEDKLIEVLITAARQKLEDYTGRAFINQTRRVYCAIRPDNYHGYPLPGAPFRKVKKCQLITRNKVNEVDAFIVDIAKPIAELSADFSYSKEGTVQINYICGYGKKAEDVPEALRQSIILLVADLYENRLSPSLASRQADTLPRLVRTLADPYRVLTLV